MSENIYGDGYEQATEDGPDVEYIFKNNLSEGWKKRYIDAKYFEECKGNRLKQYKEKKISKDTFNNFHGYCYYRQPIKTKENNMSKSLEELQKEIQDVAANLKAQIDLKFNGLNYQINALKIESQIDAMREESKRNSKPNVDYADILKKIITKYYPKYGEGLSSHPEFGIASHWYYKIETGIKYTLSIQFPKTNTIFSIAIMKAVLEFQCNVKSDTTLEFEDNRVYLKFPV